MRGQKIQKFSLKLFNYETPCTNKILDPWTGEEQILGMNFKEKDATKTTWRMGEPEKQGIYPIWSIGRKVLGVELYEYGSRIEVDGYT